MDDVEVARVANEPKLETNESRDHGITNEVAHDPVDNIEEHEYPGGLRIAAIVAALVLSIFLVSRTSRLQVQLHQKPWP
jgi:hypothetical protein